ncbi:alpha/beta fold hydrolase [Streptomyces termitum]|uniref:alpha/beta fold hydrolase n=1 Tax=Streptomyces termitum TaxID=67368 RepID=UPI0033ADF4F4
MAGDGAAGVLLVHGAGGSAEAHFGGLTARLGDRRRIVACALPDEPGADPDAVVDGFAAAAGAAGLDSFAVCGYSLGAPLAVRLAVRHPGRVRALALCAPFARADARMRLAVSVWRGLYEAGLTGLLAEQLALTGLGPRFLERHPLRLVRAALALAPAPPAGTPAHLDLAERIDVREDLARLAVPALVVVTGGDPLVAPDRQRALAAAVPGAETAELDTGHLPFWEDPEGWAGVLAGFLERFPGPVPEETGVR